MALPLYFLFQMTMSCLSKLKSNNQTTENSIIYVAWLNRSGRCQFSLMHPHAGSRPPAKIIHIIAPTLLFLLLSLSLCIHLSAMHGTHQPVYSAPVVRHPLTRPLENWASIEHDSLPRRVKGQIRHHLGQSSLMGKIGSAFLETSFSLQQHCCYGSNKVSQLKRKAFECRFG